MEKIFSALRELIASGENAVLVSVIASSGSTPRGSGAKMLVCRDGSIRGTIGGGAVEYRSIALAQPARTADDLIFQSIPSRSQLTAISQKDGFSSYQSIYAWEEEGLTDYLKGLSVEPLLTTSLPEEDWEIYITFSDDQSATRLTLSRDFLTAYLPYDNKGAIYYKLTEPLDKEALFSFLDPSAPDPDPDPTPPTLDLFFDHPELGQNPLSASRTILSESRNGVLQEERP